MFEVKITASPELVQAINNLAAALMGMGPLAMAITGTKPQAQTATVPPTVAPAAPMTDPAVAPANPANPTPAGGYAPTAQTSAPAAPTVAPAYQTNAPASTSPSNSAPAPGQVPQQQTGVPVAAPPQYTVDQIMTAGAALMDAGRVDDLMNLLRSFGVQAVTDLKPEQMGAFATALRGLGARI